MTKKKITLLSVVSVTALALTGLVMVNLDEVKAPLASYAETKSLLFDSALATSYLTGGNTYDLKTISRTGNSDNDIKIKCEGVNSYGGGRFCYCGNYQIGKKLSIIVGLNNLQSASFTFSSNYSDIIEPDEMGYSAIVKFYGEEFSFTYPDSPSWSPVIFSHEFESSDVERNVKKTLQWTKTTEVGVARYIKFDLTLTSWRSSQYYCPLYLDSFTLTWSC